jgi:hypothetical protein
MSADNTESTTASNIDEFLSHGKNVKQRGVVLGSALEADDVANALVFEQERKQQERRAQEKVAEFQASEYQIYLNSKDRCKFCSNYSPFDRTIPNDMSSTVESALKDAYCDYIPELLTDTKLLRHVGFYHEHETREALKISSEAHEYFLNQKGLDYLRHELSFAANEMEKNRLQYEIQNKESKMREMYATCTAGALKIIDRKLLKQEQEDEEMARQGKRKIYDSYSWSWKYV